MTELNSLTLEQIRFRLNGLSAKTSELPEPWRDEEFSQAAVLIPFVKIRQQWHLLFIRRAEHDLDQHSGQVAFAGGKYEEMDDDLQQTALREVREELGISPEHVTVLGKLEYHYSITHFRITPVVGFVPWPYQLNLQQLEVARAFTIPLNWLANSDHYEIRQHNHANQMPFPVVYYQEYDGEILWGATARMTLSLIALLNKK